MRRPSTRRADEISHICGCRREGDGEFFCKRQIFAVVSWQWFQQYFSGNNSSSQKKLKNSSAEKQKSLACPSVDKQQNSSWFRWCKLTLMLLIMEHRLFSTDRVPNQSTCFPKMVFYILNWNSSHLKEFLQLNMTSCVTPTMLINPVNSVLLYSRMEADGQWNPKKKGRAAVFQKLCCTILLHDNLRNKLGVTCHSRG